MIAWQNVSVKTLILTPAVPSVSTLKCEAALGIVAPTRMRFR